MKLKKINIPKKLEEEKDWVLVDLLSPFIAEDVSYLTHYIKYENGEVYVRRRKND